MVTERNIKRGLAGMLAVTLALIWMMGKVGKTEPVGLPRETDLDLPGDFEQFYDYGERVNAWREQYGIRARGGRYGVESIGRRYERYGIDASGKRYEIIGVNDRMGAEGRLSKFVKLDVDSDMNYDGTIDNFDPADQGLYVH